MAVTWLLVRVELRRRWRSLLVLILLVGVAGGASLGAFGGAARTASVVDRLRSSSHVYDVNLNPLEDVPPAVWDRVDRLPQVERSVHLPGQVGFRVLPDGGLDWRWISAVQAVVIDPGYFRDVDRPRLVAGHYPQQPDEAIINQRAADQLELSVGQRVSVLWFDRANIQSGQVSPEDGVFGVVTIAGVIETFDDALRDPDDPRLMPMVAYGPGSLKPEVTPNYELRVYVLRQGDADVAGFVAAARSLAGDTFAVQESRTAVERANRSLRPYVAALAAFGLLVLVGGFVLVAQAIARHARQSSGDFATFRALGITVHQLAVLTLIESGIVAASGATLAIGIAAVTSAFTPLGYAASLETEPGIRVDPIILAAGFVGVFVIVVAAWLAAMWSDRRRVRASRRGAALTAVLPPLAVPVVPRVGISFALGPSRHQPGSSQRRSLWGWAVVLSLMIGALTFGANLARFATTPAQFGWRWDAMVEPMIADLDTVVEQLEADDSVENVVEGLHGTLVSAQQTVPLIALGHGEPGASVEIIAGRPPIASDEVVLGRDTLRSLDTDIGETVQATTREGHRDLRVVGIGVFPRLTAYQAAEPTGLGVGAAVMLETMALLDQGDPDGGTFLLVTGANANFPDPEQLDRLLFAGDPSQGTVYGVQRPVDVRGYAEMRGMPLLLVAVLALLMLAALAHSLTLSARHRRRDVAVLSAIGFTPGQIQRTFITQSIVIVGLVSVVAAPIGMLAGRWAWRSTARWLGISDTTSYPTAQLLPLLFTIATVSIAIAALVGRRASKQALSAGLQAE
jgi:hypothetical protein